MDQRQTRETDRAQRPWLAIDRTWPRIGSERSTVTQEAWDYATDADEPLPFYGSTNS